MDPRCSVVRKAKTLPVVSCAALVALTAVTFVIPTHADARGRTKVKAPPVATTQPSHQSGRQRARPVALTRRATPIALAPSAGSSPISGPAAIRAANVEALAPSRADGFMNAAQVFPYETGRVFEVWTAPLRITTISLEQGETITNKAAGDTERWMIGDTTSGSGATLQTHILVKPFKAGIATNMVVTTNRRVYLLSLRAAEGADAFNAAVTWTHPVPLPTFSAQNADAVSANLIGQGRTAAIETLNQNYRIKAGWRRPPWTPISVSDDGRQTFITFPESLASTEAPPLFVMNEAGDAQLVNWRKQGNVYVVDRLFQKAELRLGGLNPRVVKIERKEVQS
jgi:type IV secretion system protein TrbG